MATEKKKFSASQIEAMYEQLLKEHTDPVPLDEKIEELRSLCIENGVDHSKYELRGPKKTLPSKKNVLANVVRLSDVEALVSLPELETVNVRDVLDKYRKHYPFLAYLLGKKEVSSPRRERLVVLYGRDLSEGTIVSTFSPDEIYSLSDYSKEKLSAEDTSIFLILLHSSDDEGRMKTEKIIEILSPLKYFTQTDFENGEESYWKKQDTNKFNETLSQSKKLLIHEAVCAEQECLIKSFFGDTNGFLIYSDLKGGFSGSRVLLVSLSGSHGEPRKYVVKICRKDDSKLDIERANFKNFVEPFFVNKQTVMADWKETANFHAIRYPFASLDTISDSISFSKKYSKTESGESLKSLFIKIFDHDLQSKWRKTTHTRKKPFLEAFQKIINWEETQKTLKQLLAPEFSKTPPFSLTDLETLIKKDIEYLECTAHGDLHSDNIQVQDVQESVFLIDFGLTGLYPAGVDYAALEASIRYRLLDYSIDINNLNELDSDPLQQFGGLITYGSTFLHASDKAIKCASEIRQKFLNDFADKKSLDLLRKQYLFCLLAISLRQINFSDLNRRYILNFISTILPVLNR